MNFLKSLQIVGIWDRFEITSNRESGFGRYDVMREPKNLFDDAIIVEFKVHRPKKEKDLEAAVEEAKGIAPERNRNNRYINIEQ